MTPGALQPYSWANSCVQTPVMFIDREGSVTPVVEEPGLLLAWGDDPQGRIYYGNMPICQSTSIVVRRYDPSTEGGDEIQVSSVVDGTTDSEPAFSPDSQWIVFNRKIESTDQVDVLKVDVAGNGEEAVLSDGAQNL